MRRLGNAALLGTCVMVAAVAVGGFRGPEDPTEAPPAVAPGQGQRGVWDLLVAIPFRVDEPFTHWWRAERPEVQAGHLLVLAVDPIVVRPRQTAEPKVAPMARVGSPLVKILGLPVDSEPPNCVI